jgi:hypothetical protein
MRLEVRDWKLECGPAPHGRAVLFRAKLRGNLRPREESDEATIIQVDVDR